VSATPAEALLFDLGGVVMGLDWDRCFDRWAACAGVRPEVLRARYSFDHAYERHERGEISETQYYQALRESLGVELTDTQWASGWSAIFTEEIAPVVELVARVKERVPVYAFSNTNVAHQRVWSRRFAPALSHFREVFVSCTLGARKPERESFQRIARTIGVAPEAILFFDDTPQNVEGARSAGLPAVWVRTPQDVADALRPWLAT
jgi:FMN phosphatase YigB (HAD superfamily)